MSVTDFTAAVEKEAKNSREYKTLAAKMKTLKVAVKHIVAEKVCDFGIDPLLNELSDGFVGPMVHAPLKWARISKALVFSPSFVSIGNAELLEKGVNGIHLSRVNVYFGIARQPIHSIEQVQMSPICSVSTTETELSSSFCTS